MKALLALAATVSAFAIAPAAQAATFFPGDDEFRVSGDGTTGTDPLSAAFSRIGLSGSGSDSFVFRIGPETDGGDIIGLGSGSVTTSFTGARDRLVFNSVTFSNGVSTFDVVIVPTTSNGSVSGFSGSLNDVPIFSGLTNSLTVNYTASRNSSFSGTLTFTPTAAIPEPSTWLMMILGFAAVGFSMRRRKEQEARVRYAF